MPLRWFVLKAALAAVALVALAHLVEREALLEAARGARVLPALAALALAPLNVWLEAHRWHRLLRRIAPDVRARDALSAVLAGYPLGLLTPGRAGDYAGRALYLRGVEGAAPVGAWGAAALTFAERMATLACCLGFGLAALTYYLLAQTLLEPLAWATVLWTGLFGTGAFLFVLLHPRFAHAALDVLLPFRRVRVLLTYLDRFSTADARTLVVLSALRYGIFSTQFVLLVQAFAPGTPWLGAYAGVALVFFAKSAIPSFTLGDLGVRESVAVFFLGAFGVAAAAAFHASLALFVLNLFLPAVVGVPFLLKLRVEAAAPAPAVEPREA